MNPQSNALSIKCSLLTDWRLLNASDTVDCDSSLLSSERLPCCGDDNETDIQTAAKETRTKIVFIVSTGKTSVSPKLENIVM